MIIVRVELHSAVTGKITELARMKIANIGGNAQVGDYRGVTLRGRSKEQLDKQQVTHEGKVIGHRRQALHVWNLVAKMLNGMGYGK